MSVLDVREMCCGPRYHSNAPSSRLFFSALGYAERLWQAEAADGSFTDDVDVCAGTETFCPPVGGCGPPLACPVSCSIGRLRGAAPAQEDLR